MLKVCLPHKIHASCEGDSALAAGYDFCVFRFARQQTASAEVINMWNLLDLLVCYTATTFYRLRNSLATYKIAFGSCQ